MCLVVGRSDEVGSEVLTERARGTPSGFLHLEERYRFGRHDEIEGNR